MRRKTIALLGALMMLAGIVSGAAPGMASDRFEDVPDSNVFHDDIAWLADEDITRGCNPPANTQYCPERSVTRGEMAAFFVRGLHLTETDGTEFTDDDGHVHEDDIRRLAAADITRGCNPPENTNFCPDRSITRGEMAAFFVRALDLTETQENQFTDTVGHLFEEEINRISAADITRGCNPPENDEYCPEDPVTREQMAAFFHRALGGPLDLSIAHINDHHSYLQANSGSLILGGAETDVEMGGFGRVVTRIDQVSAENEHVLKVHAGDAITGTLFYTLFLGEADAAVMNEACFDVFELGNHEFDGGDATLAQFLDWLNEGDCGTVTLGANVIPEVGTPLAPEGPNDYIQPYTIETYHGKRVGIIGIDIANKTRNSSSPLPTTQFLDEVETTQRYVDELEAMGVDRIVAVTHYQYDNDLALAAAVDGVDVIVGGDSHTLLGAYEPYGLGPSGPYPTHTEDSAGDPVCIVQAWQYSNIVGELAVTWDEDGLVSNCDGTPHLLLGDTFTREEPDPNDPNETIDVPVTGAELEAVMADIEGSGGLLEIVEPDADTEAVIATFAEEVDALAAEVIGTVPETLCSERIPGQGDQVSPECPVEATEEHGGDIQQLVTEAFRVRSFESDFAIQNAGGVRLQVDEGEFTIADAYELLPFANTMVNLEMTGQEIIEVLNEALDFALLPDGSTGAYPYGAGIRWTTDFTTGTILNIEVRPTGETVWTPLVPTETYTVVTNSFIASGQDGYVTFGEVTADGRATDTGLDYAQSFIDYIEQDAGGVLAKVPVEEYSTHMTVGTYTP